MKKASIFLYALLLLSVSCQLTDNSQPEEGSNTITTGELLRSCISQTAFNQSALVSRTNGTLMQYHGQFDSKVNSFDGYLFSSSFFEPIWSEGYYAGSLVNINELRNLAIVENDELLEGVAMILHVLEYSNLTMMFGDVPYSEALSGGDDVTPVYDTQQFIIEDLIQLLDTASDKLVSANSLDSSISTNDVLYQGDLTLWRKMAYGLKARILLNGLKKNIGSLSDIQECLDQSFENADEEASFQFDSEFANPQYLFAVQRPSTFFVGDYFHDLLSLNDDPRLSAVSLTSVSNNLYFEAGTFEPIPFQQNARMPLLSYTEIMFMKTEVEFYQNGNSSELEDLLATALSSSMSYHQLEIDGNIQSFIDETSTMMGLNNESAIRRIMEQSYIAYYGFNHLQSWSNFRRTGYPEIQSTAINPSELNPSNRIPVRYLYPSSEYIYNGAHVQQAVSSQNGALLDTDIWIFK